MEPASVSPADFLQNPIFAPALEAMDPVTREVARQVIDLEREIPAIARQLGMTRRRCWQTWEHALELLRKAVRSAPRKRRPRKPKGAEVRTL